MRKKLLLISFDAVSSENVKLLGTMPNFASLVKRGTFVDDVNSVFVSNTYPAHASVVTGCHPNRHGVIENCLFQPDRKEPDWYWRRDYIKVNTLFDAAKSAGLSTGAILWPVTARADIDYNLPEVFSPDGSESQVAVSLKNGSKLYTIEVIFKNITDAKKMARQRGQPARDDFAASVAAYTIRKKKPDLLMIHFTDVDDTKHRFGPDSKETGQALRRMDERLGKILSALKKAKLEEKTSIIVFGDHSCLPTHTAIDLNERLSLPEGAAFHHAGGTAFLHVEDPEQIPASMAAVKKLLKTPGSGVSRLVLPEEMAISGLGRDFVLGVEADEGYCFGAPKRGQHGYTLRHEKYRTFYLAAGAGVEKGAKLTGGCIVDICPLAVRLLEIPLWEMDGVSKIPFI